MLGSASAQTAIMGFLFAVLMIGGILLILPGYIASRRQHPNAAAIWVCALIGAPLTGGIAWIVALVWAFTGRSADPVARPAPVPPPFAPRRPIAICSLCNYSFDVPPGSGRTLHCAHCGARVANPAQVPAGDAGFERNEDVPLEPVPEINVEELLPRVVRCRSCGQKVKLPPERKGGRGPKCHAGVTI